MKKSYGMWVNGQEVPAKSGRTFAVLNPATQEELCQVAAGEAEDINNAVEIALKAFEDGRWLLRDRLDYIIEIEVKSTGRAVREMKAQIPRVPEWLEYFGSLVQTAEGGVTPFGGDFVNYYRRIPLGVVGQITPWNHPLLIAMKKIAPALACGNSIVVKPSELAPVAVIELGRILSEAGVPAGVVNIIPGLGIAAGKALAENPKLSKIDVTGGTVTGRSIASAAGRNLVPVTAELGGKAPMIIFDDVDLDEVVNAAAFATFIATGQTCIAATRLLVHKNIFEAFKAKLKAKLQGLVIGDPSDPATQIGPVISPGQLKRVEEFLEGAKAEGATILTGGARPTHLTGALAKGNYFLPTVIADVTPTMNVVREEVFGPVTVALAFSDEQEAIRLCNDSPYGLAAGVWTNDVRRAHRVVSKLRVGIVWINDWHKNDPASPWGGMKDSGYGRENGLECFREYSQAQSVVVNFGTTKSDWFGAAPARYN